MFLTFVVIFFRYHTDDQIKQQFAEMERKHMTIANFDANENEISMAFPSLKITDDVSSRQNLSKNAFLIKI